MDAKEEKLRRDVMEKESRKKMEALYERRKAEDEKEMEKKKKEFSANFAKKNFTFDYIGKIMYLKPFRDDNIAVNEILDVQFNNKKPPKMNNPPETIPKIKTAELLEKDGPEKTAFTLPGSKNTGSVGEESKQAKKTKFSGMFKPAPPLQEIFQVAEGVTLILGKNQVKKGPPSKAESRLNYNQFKDKVKGPDMSQKQLEDEEKQKLEAQKLEKEKRYRRTIDNWKEELKKGLKEEHLHFDPELLINLIMTDDMEVDKEKKMARRAEREQQYEEYALFKKKLDEIAKDPEGFLNRVAVFRGQDGEEIQADQKVPVDPRLVNKFQQALSKFNEVVAGKATRDSSAGPLDFAQGYPSTEMEEEKFKFTRPPQMAHDNLLGNQKVGTVSLKAPRIRTATSAVKPTAASLMSGADARESNLYNSQLGVLPQNQQYTIKRVQSGNIVRRGAGQDSRIQSAVPFSQFDKQTRLGSAGSLGPSRKGLASAGEGSKSQFLIRAKK